jgi:AAA domain
MNVTVTPFAAGSPPEIEAPELKVFGLDEFVQRPTVSSLIRGVVPAKAIVVVFGPPKGGKTFSVCDLTMHAAHGLDWHGCAIPRRLRVLYLCGEGVSGMRVRLKAWLEHHDNIGEPGAFKVLPQALSLPNRVATLVESIRAFKPDIVVTDTLNTYFGGGDENSTSDMTAFCDALRYIRDQLGCAVVVIHHTGHGDSGRERGSIVLRASADVIVQVAKDEGTKKLVGFQVIAARDIETMEAPIALKLTRHDTEWLDEDGEPLVTCVVAAADQPVTLPGRGGHPLGAAQAVVLQAAQELARAGRPEANGEVILARHDIAHLAKQRGHLSRQSVSSSWPSLEQRKLLRRIEPGSVAIRVRT